MRLASVSRRAALLWAGLVIVPVAYFWLVGRYGWSDADDGFVLGSAWRVFNGEVPYRDFIDVRPPVSAWLHAVELAVVDPRYAFAAARFVAIVQMWAYSAVAVWSLAAAGGRRVERTWALLALALGGFLLSASAFTPMPWHTTDGIMFCTLGAALIVARRGLAPALAAGMLIALGMGTKQSFYPVALLALAYLEFSERRKDAVALAAGIGLAAAAFAAWLVAEGLLPAFLSQTSARTGAGYILAAGLWSYRDMGLPILAMLVAGAGAGWLAARLTRRPLGATTALGIGAVAIVAVYAMRLADGAWVNASTLGYPHALFLIAAAVAGWRVHRGDGRAEGLAGLLMLGIAWCASLSIGFPTPLLFMAPVVAVPLLWLEPERRPVASWIVAGFAGVMAILAAIYPYEERDPRFAHDCPLARVEPKLALIVSGPRTCAKLAEYEALRRTHPGPFVTLPAFATSYMLAGGRDPVPVDWPTVAENAGASQRLIDAAEARVRYAFVEESEAADPADDQREELLDHIRDFWRPVARGQVYTVYRNPRL